MHNNIFFMHNNFQRLIKKVKYQKNGILSNRLTKKNIKYKDQI